MIFGTFHKTGTYILSETLRVYNLLGSKSGSEPIKYRFFDSIDDAGSDLEKNNSTCLIRHPFEVIMSGMRYHQKCVEEQWLVEDILECGNGKETYQEKINSLNGLDGKILFEMIHCGQDTVSRMLKVAENYPQCLTVKLEDFVSDPETVANSISSHMTLDSDILERAINRVLGWSDFGHQTHGNACDFTYKTHFKDFHYTASECLFPVKKTLDILGYSK